MASPQLEDGYTRIANEILNAFLKTNLSAYQSRILWGIIRKTYGFGKKEDRIPLSQLVELTGLRKQHVWRTFRELKERNLVTKRGYFVAFNKDYQQWRELPKGVTSHKSNQRGLRKYPKGVTKSNLRGGPQKKERNFSKERLRDSSNPAVKQFIDFWFQTFQEKFNKPYTVKKGKDGKLVKTLLKTHSLDQLKELAKAFFQSEDSFIQKTDYSIGIFSNQINKVVCQEEKERPQGFQSTGSPLLDSYYRKEAKGGQA